MSIQAIGRVLARFGELFWSPHGFHMPKIFHQLSRGNWKGALAFFLESYAFERAGRSPHYPKAAAEAVREYSKKVPRADLENFLWKTFLRKIGASPSGRGANLQNNPLAPSSKKTSITAFILSLGKHEHNLILWAKRGLKQRRTHKLFQELTAVRGIGPKISSFFLRDVADAFGIEIKDPEEAVWLQPMDRWTKRGAEMLAPQLGKELSPGQDDAWVLIEVGQRAGVRPTLVNTGLWMLGAQFAQTEERFREALSSPEALGRFLQTQTEKRKAELELLKTSLQNLAG